MPHTPAAAAPSTPAVSLWRDVWLLAVAQVLSGLGAAVIVTLLILNAQEHGGEDAGLAVAAVVIAAAVPTVLFAPITGRLADRFDSRLLLIVAGCIQIGACLLIPVLPGITGKIVAMALLFTGTAIAQPVRAALLPAMVTEEDLPRAGAIGQTASVIGPMGGPPVAGFAYLYGVDPTMRWAAIGFVSTIVLGLVLRTRRSERVTSSGASWRAEPRLPLDSLLKVTFLGTAAVVATVSVVNVVEVFFVRETLGASPGIFGVLTAMWPLGMVAGAWAQAKMAEKRDDGTLAVWLFVTLGATAVLIATLSSIGSAVWMVPIWLIAGSLNGADNVLITTLMGRRAAPEARGRVAAIMQAAIQGSLLVGYVIGGLSLEAGHTPRGIIMVAGSAGLIAVLTVLPWVRTTVRHVRREALAGAE
ncbi:MFS family permease [Allocatelliglobosispora scoriae]|uniref:MFS family permease n=1 Tax=Allocatelliglobosispora scoriae TaxID=643052 RepID=A0A841BVJ0_9ACTN|nr:MFS transporter [Allocatelliglobosispora scoriae]MBB5870761.1 MFS family permease [Allocatelliglobosispora scoriae]